MLLRSSVFSNARYLGVRIKKREYSAPSVTANEETEVKYPPILDCSFEGRYRRNRQDVAEGVARARTVEEKMIKINMPRYYGWKSLMLNETVIPYNAADQMQYITKTHVPKESGLPAYYDNLVTPEELKEKVEKIRGSIEDCLVFEYSSRNRAKETQIIHPSDSKNVDNLMSKAVSKQIHRLLMLHLASEKPHLLEAEIDEEPRVEAFWFVGGIQVPGMIKYRRRGEKLKKKYSVTKMPEDFEDYPVDRAVQYIGQPNFHLRHSLPLPEIIPVAESENPDFDVPEFTYDPQVLSYRTGRRHGTNIPGFWPGDKNEFGFLSYNKCGHLTVRRYDDIPDALKVQATLGSWAWLLSQACNLGFSTLNDITYPMTNQMIITNGQHWTFSAYQLNTILLHTYNNKENPRRNICWMTKPMKLFDKIEKDRVYGLNTEVLENLIKFYLNEPKERVGVEMKPYLQTGEGLVANIPGKMKRNWLEERFKLLQSCRPRHKPLPEVYNWEDIFIRKLKMRPMDKKRQPWQFGINVWHRKLDDHRARYIPRPVRILKKNPKYVPMFYPK